MAYKSKATLSIGDISVVSSDAGVPFSLISSCGFVEDSLLSSAAYSETKGY